MTLHNVVTFAPKEPAIEQESPVERAAYSAACAIEDLDAAIWQATTRGELQVTRVLARELIKKLERAASVAETLDTHFEQMRGR